MLGCLLTGFLLGATVAWLSGGPRAGAKREALAQEAGAMVMRDVALIPLHHQVVSWAMRKSLAYMPRTDEYTFAHHFKPQ